MIDQDIIANEMLHLKIGEIITKNPINQNYINANKGFSVIMFTLPAQISRNL